MRRWIVLSGLLWAAVATAPAAPVLLQGTFATDDQVELFRITTLTDEIVTIQSYGYGGGSVGATTIDPGGFAPNVILFDPTGQEIGSDQGGHSGITNQDPVTLNYDDPFFQEDLSPGVYTVALAVWDNLSLDGTLADGFEDDGDPGFTCQEGGVTGTFCDVTTATYVSRTGNCAITIDGADSVQDLSAVPEPGTLPLALIGGALGLIAAEKRSRGVKD